MNDERPVLSATLIVGVVVTAIDLAVAFGAPITAGQKEAVIAFVPAFWVAIITLYGIARPNVVSRARAAILVKAAANNPQRLLGAASGGDTNDDFLRRIEAIARSETGGME